MAISLLKSHLKGDFSEQDEKPWKAQDGDKVYKENEDLLKACEAMELSWKTNMCLYKGLAMQQKYLAFLSGCAKTDTPRFAKMLVTNFGPKGSAGFEAAIKVCVRVITCVMCMSICGLKIYTCDTCIHRRDRVCDLCSDGSVISLHPARPLGLNWKCGLHQAPA